MCTNGPMMTQSRILVLILCFIFFLPVPTVEAADITVSGACSLAEAIQNANDDAQTNTDCPAGSGADIITLTADITLGAALPSITSNITIIGVGFNTISGDDSYRVLRVANGGDLTLQWVSINNGSAATGAGLLVESGGEAELQNVGFQYNSATGSGGSGGGAIKAQGNVTIVNSFFLRNTAPFGGAIDNSASMNIYSSRFHGNSATSYGGAIMAQAGGSVFLVNSVVYLSEGSGGAIRLLDTSTGIIHFSAVLDNSSSGIVVGWPTGAHTPQLNLVSSIVAGNTGSECQVVSGSIDANVSNLI